MKVNSAKPKTGYMCSIAFYDEAENTDVTVWPTLKSLKEDHKYDTCGIVKVQISFMRQVRKENF